jgi:hypothetical protein
VPNSDPVSPRIIETIPTKFDWYYRAYYPELFILSAREKQAIDLSPLTSLTSLEEEISKEIEQEIG